MASLSSLVLAMLIFDPFTKAPVVALRSLTETPRVLTPAKLAQKSRPSALKAVSVSPPVLVVPGGLLKVTALTNAAPRFVETRSPRWELAAILAGSFGLTEIIGSMGTKLLMV